MASHSVRQSSGSSKSQSPEVAHSKAVLKSSEGHASISHFQGVLGNQGVAQLFRSFSGRGGEGDFVSKASPTSVMGGLPQSLKASLEHMSGYAMDDVRVHYNSSQPAQLSALAYARGSEIYLSPGQEQHLPHEAWHVVQQKQGRVTPDSSIAGQAVNSSSALEQEADQMGARASSGSFFPASGESVTQVSSVAVTQRVPEPIDADDTGFRSLYRDDAIDGIQFEKLRDHVFLYRGRIIVWDPDEQQYNGRDGAEVNLEALQAADEPDAGILDVTQGEIGYLENADGPLTSIRTTNASPCVIAILHDTKTRGTMVAHIHRANRIQNFVDSAKARFGDENQNLQVHLITLSVPEDNPEKDRQDYILDRVSGDLQGTFDWLLDDDIVIDREHENAMITVANGTVVHPADADVGVDRGHLGMARGLGIEVGWGQEVADNSQCMIVRSANLEAQDEAFAAAFPLQFKKNESATNGQSVIQLMPVTVEVADVSLRLQTGTLYIVGEDHVDDAAYVEAMLALNNPQVTFITEGFSDEDEVPPGVIPAELALPKKAIEAFYAAYQIGFADTVKDESQLKARGGRVNLGYQRFAELLDDPGFQKFAQSRGYKFLNHPQAVPLMRMVAESSFFKLSDNSLSTLPPGFGNVMGSGLQLAAEYYFQLHEKNQSGVVDLRAPKRPVGAGLLGFLAGDGSAAGPVEAEVSEFPDAPAGKNYEGLFKFGGFIKKPEDQFLVRHPGMQTLNEEREAAMTKQIWRGFKPHTATVASIGEYHLGSVAAELRGPPGVHVFPNWAAFVAAVRV